MACEATVDSPNGPVSAHRIMDELHLYPFLDWDAEESGFHEDAMYHHHLVDNHRPPVHPAFVQTAKDAVAHARGCDG